MISGETSSVSNAKAPVVHVTKYGLRINSIELCDSGFLRHKLEQEARHVFSSENESSNRGEEINSNKSFAKNVKRRNTIMQSYATASPNY